MAVQKSAIVFGATGLIGGHLLHELLDDPAYANVTAVVRRDIGIQHPKLKQLVADYLSIPEVGHQLIADDVFCCLGTTKKKTPDLEEYYRIDHDYPVAAARYTYQRGAKAFFLVSALGADERSGNFYLRMKGETERDIIGVGFERVHVFRPSLLMGTRRESRLMEQVARVCFELVNPLLISRLSKYRAIPAPWVARAMCRAAATEKEGLHVYYWADMKQYV